MRINQKKNDKNHNITENLKYKTGTNQEKNIFYKIEDNFIRFDALTNSVLHGFSNNQRNAKKEAAYKNGIKNVYIINDPLSTGIYYYAFENKIQKNEKY